jgi:putative ribosome biogenesis GTPase RsgA
VVARSGLRRLWQPHDYAQAAQQVLAANVDMALVFEQAAAPNERRLQRLLALARSEGVLAALVLTKADLPDAP